MGFAEHELRSSWGPVWTSPQLQADTMIKNSSPALVSYQHGTVQLQQQGLGWGKPPGMVSWGPGLPEDISEAPKSGPFPGGGDAIHLLAP